MRRIIVKEARPGMIAARSVPHPLERGKVLLTAGDLLSTSSLIQLHQMGIYDLWVNDPGLEFFDQLCSSQPTRPQQRLAEALQESFMRLSQTVARPVFKRFDVVLEDVAHSLISMAPAIPCFAALTEDDALLAHSCDVAALATLLGLQLDGYLVEQRKRLNGRQARDVVNLALGCLFHDVGELLLPAMQRESRRAMSPLEEPGGEDWKQHADEGFTIVRGRLDPSAAVVVQHHHEHFDGTGFAGRPGDGPPRLQNGAGIHVYARIAMAADVFCQILFAGMGEGGGRMIQPMVKALWKVQQMPVRQWFDPIVHQGLLGLLPPFVEGMVVTLSDQQPAVVTRVDPSMPCYPAVRIIGGHAGEDAGENVDLAEQDELHVAAVEGSDIGTFLYGIRKGRPLVAA